MSILPEKSTSFFDSTNESSFKGLAGLPQVPEVHLGGSFKQMIPRLAAKIDTDQMATRNPVNSPVDMEKWNPLFAEMVGYLSPVVVWDFWTQQQDDIEKLSHSSFLKVPGDIPTAVKAPSTLQSSQWPANDPTKNVEENRHDWWKSYRYT